MRDKEGHTGETIMNPALKGARWPRLIAGAFAFLALTSCAPSYYACRQHNPRDTCVTGY